MENIKSFGKGDEPGRNGNNPMSEIIESTKWWRDKRKRERGGRVAMERAGTVPMRSHTYLAVKMFTARSAPPLSLSPEKNGPL